MSLFSHAASRLSPRDALTPEEVGTGLKWWMRNGLGAQTMDTLTVGAFITAFALEFGASNLYIGLLAAVPHLTQILQIPGLHLGDRWRNRRLQSVMFAGVSRPMYLVMGLCAFIVSPALALAVLMVAFTLRYAFAALMSCAWNSWIRDLVPEERLGRLLGTRLKAMTTLGIALGLAAGAFVDMWDSRGIADVKYAYSVLFIGAFLGGVYSTWCSARMPEPRMARFDGGTSLVDRLRRPYHDANYRRLLVFLGSWNFAINLAAPFFTVHMLKRLQLEMWIVVALTLLSQLVNVAVIRQWGAIADRMSNKAVLGVCAPVFVACIFAWTFTTLPDPHAGTIPLLIVIHALAGLATAGVTLASGNIAMKLAPKGDAIAYLANNSLVNSAAAGIAPIIGGLLADFFTSRELSVVLRWRAPGGELEFSTLSISQWDFFFLMATVIGLFAIGRLSRVREVGEVEEKLVLNEMYMGARRFVRNLSSIAGLRQATELPTADLRAGTRRPVASPNPAERSL